MYIQGHQMSSIKKFLLLGTVLISAAFSKAAATDSSISDITISAGWRYDDFSSHIHQNIPIGSNESLIGGWKLKLTGINIWQIGGQFHLPMPGFFYDSCDYDLAWMENLYMRGNAYGGWLGCGKYHETKEYGSGVPSTQYHANIHKGSSFDGTIGLGFLYPVCDEWSIGPIAGYSYDRLHINTKNLESSAIVPGTDYSVKFISTWKGPWLGFDFTYYFCEWNVTVDAGYEYHWASWNGKKQLSNPDVGNCTEFSDNRHSSNAHGNVAYLDARYTWCECWDFILGFKYQGFDVESGHMKPENQAASGCLNTEKLKIKMTKWNSYAVNFDIGYRF